MGGCSILGCKKRSEQKEDGLSFHSFPSDPDIKKKWTDATGRANYKQCLPIGSKVCSLHFDSDCFDYKKKLTVLKPCSIPTKYVHNIQTVEVPISQYTKKKVERAPILHDDVQNITQRMARQIVNNLSASGSGKKVIKPIDRAHEATLKRLEKQKQYSANLLKKLRAVRESKRRLSKKMAKLENILIDLKSKMFFNTEEAEIHMNIDRL